MIFLLGHFSLACLGLGRACVMTCVCAGLCLVIMSTPLKMSKHLPCLLSRMCVLALLKVSEPLDDSI